MNQPTYPNLRQSLLLVLFFFGSYGLFSFLTGALPQLLGWQLSGLYMISMKSINPVCILPLVLYISYKSGIQIKWRVKLPGIQLVSLLILLAFAGFIIAYPLARPVNYWHELMAGRIKIMTLLIADWNPERVINMIGGVLLVPIFEEIFWRKQILGLLLKRYSPVVGILVNSVLFALGHGRLHDIGSLIIWGLLFGVVYYQTNSIEASILTHAITNLFSNATKHGFMESNGFPLFKYIAVMVVCALVIYLIIKNLDKYRLVREDTVVHEKSNEGSDLSSI